MPDRFGSTTIYYGVGLRTGEFTKGLGSMSAALGHFAAGALARFGSLGKSFAALWRNWGVISRVASFAAGAALASVAKRAANMAGEFDSAMRKVWSLTEVSRSTFDRWGENVIAISKKVPVAAKDLADALYWIKSAMPGSTEAEMFKVLETAARGSVGGVADLETAAKALAITMQGLNLKDPMKVMDIMNKTVERGVLTLSDFASHIGVVAGSAALAGIPLEEIAAAIAVLTRHAIPVNTAFMALNQVLMKFLKPSADARQVMQQFGIELSLNTLRVKGLTGALIEIAEKVPDKELARLFPNVRALKAALPLAGTAAREFAQELEIMGNASGTTERMFKKNASSLKNQLQLLRNQIDAALIKLGKAIIPVANNFIKAFNRMLTGGNKFASGLGKALKGVLSVVLNFSKAVGTALGAFGPKATAAIVALTVAVIGLGKALGGAGLMGALFKGVKGIAVISSLLITKFVGGFAAAKAAGAGFFASIAGGVQGLTGMLSGINWSGLISGGIATAIAAVGTYLIARMKQQDEEKERLWKKWMRDDVEWRTVTARNVNELVIRYKQLRDTLIPTARAHVQTARSAEELTNAQEQLNSLQAEYKSVSLELAKTFPTLLKGFDESGAAILDTDEKMNMLMKTVGLLIPGIDKLAPQAGKWAVAHAEMERGRDAWFQYSDAIERISAEVERLVERSKETGITPEIGKAIMQTISQSVKSGESAVKGFQAIMAGFSGKFTPDQMLWLQNLMGLITTLDEIKARTGLTVADSVTLWNQYEEEMKKISGELHNTAYEAGKNAQKVGSAIGSVPQEIITMLQSKVPAIRQMGKDLLAQMALGILEAAGVSKEEAVSQAQAIANAIMDGIKPDKAGVKGKGIEVMNILGAALKDAGVETGKTAKKGGQDVGKKIGEGVKKGAIDATKGLAELLNKRISNEVGKVKKEYSVKIWVNLIPKVKRGKSESEGGGDKAGTGFAIQARDTASVQAWEEAIKKANNALDVMRQAWGGFVGEMKAKQLEEVENALLNITGGMWEHLTVWRQVRGEYEELTRQMEAYERRIADLEQSLNDLQFEESELNRQLQIHRDNLSKLQAIKIKGELAADEKSFRYRHELAKIELAILKAKRAGNYSEIVRLKTRQRELELAEQIHNLETQVKFDPLRRNIEKLLDPLSTQEMSYKNIISEIQKEQKEISKKEKALKEITEIITKQRNEQTKLRLEMEKIRRVYDVLQKELDEYAQHFTERYRQMQEAARDLNRTISGRGAGQIGAVATAPNLNLQMPGNNTVVNVDIDGRRVASVVSRHLARNTVITAKVV